MPSEEVSHFVSYIPVRDAQSARQAFEAGAGATVELSVGGKLDTIYNHPFAYIGAVLRVAQGKRGTTAVVKRDGVHLILSGLLHRYWL